MLTKTPQNASKTRFSFFRSLRPSVGLSKLFRVYNDALPLFRPFYPHCLILYDLLKPIPDESGFSSSPKNCAVQFLHSLQRSSPPQKIILNALNTRKLRHQTHLTKIRVQDTFKINSASGTPFCPVKTRFKSTCPQIGNYKVYYIIYFFSYNIISLLKRKRNRQCKCGRCNHRPHLCCWLQTAKIPSLFRRLDAQHQQFINLFFVLPDFFSQLGNCTVQCRLFQ